MEFKILSIILVGLICTNHVQSKRKRHNKYHCKGMFLCDEDYCIEPRFVCDGYAQCSDGSDEAYCPFKPPKCNDYQFKCPGEDKCCQLCNGIPECSTGVDENNCAPVCKKGEVVCADGNCAIVGDGNNDCSDMADESCPACPAIPSPLECETGKMACKRESTGQMECVPACDGQKDCVGGLDELPALQCELTCPSFQVKCVVDDEGNEGCRSPCADTRQCKNFDERGLTTSACTGIRNQCESLGFDVFCELIYNGKVCCGCTTGTGNDIGACR